MIKIMMIRNGGLGSDFSYEYGLGVLKTSKTVIFGRTESDILLLGTSVSRYKNSIVLDLGKFGLPSRRDLFSSIAPIIQSFLNY